MALCLYSAGVHTPTASRHKTIMWHLFMSLPWPSRPTGEQKLLVRSANICARQAQQAHAD
jgi:hypothetical protein